MAFAARSMGYKVKLLQGALGRIEKAARSAEAAAQRSSALQAGLRSAESKTLEATALASAPRTAYDAALSGSKNGRFVVQLLSKLDGAVASCES